MSRDDLIVGIAGAGGDGVVSVGELLIQVGAHEGLFGMLVKSFGPQIRGGESSVRVRLASRRVLSQGDDLDVLIAFNWADYGRFRSELAPGPATLIYVDELDKTPPEQIPLPESLKGAVIRVPFEKLAVEKGGSALAKNIVAVGVLAGALSLPRDGFARAIEKKFGRKGEQVVAANIAALDAGVAVAAEHPRVASRVTVREGEARMVISGNEAFAFGSLVAGCRFFAGYPITPQSEVMEWLGKELPKFGGTMMQPEDELASISMAIGASTAGVKALTASSGPGISLKLEAMGLASMAELPLVVLNVQRVGPSTGIPTKTEQADLLQGLYGTHGDAPRVVVSTTDVQDCFEVAVDAFNIAERYQTPVLVLSDQAIGHRTDAIPPFDLGTVKVVDRRIATEAELAAVDPHHGFKRYAETDSGVSPMTIPGQARGNYLMSGLEHDERGWPVSGSAVHQQMSEKRARKLEVVPRDYEHLTLVAGDPKAEVALLAWGAAKGAALEAVEQLAAAGFPVRVVIPRLLMPFPLERVERELEGRKVIHVVELSFSGQFHTYLRSLLRPELIARLVRHSRAGAAPLGVNEICRWIGPAAQSIAAD
ncbi:MAG TPA: 2-oxoacid:acceptor oxidoreductase subunit alpha [Gemmatimonadales bacterium]|nr:2-oxoacid:acceptor oxidoreductase subunit alpha [Gemmatimonadales bacterium]